MKAADFIKKEEGLRLKAYLDQAGIPTIGYGTTIYEDGKKVKLGDFISKEVAESLLTKDMDRRWNAIKYAVKVRLNENQISAIVSLTYNIGVGGFVNSTLLRRINAGASEQDIRAAFAMWNKITVKDPATGLFKKVENNGLTGRRKREADLYFLNPDR